MYIHKSHSYIEAYVGSCLPVSGEVSIWHTSTRSPCWIRAEKGGRKRGERKGI